MIYYFHALNIKLEKKFRKLYCYLCRNVLYMHPIAQKNSCLKSGSYFNIAFPKLCCTETCSCVYCGGILSKLFNDSNIFNIHIHRTTQSFSQTQPVLCCPVCTVLATLVGNVEGGILLIAQLGKHR